MEPLCFDVLVNGKFEDRLFVRFDDDYSKSHEAILGIDTHQITYFLGRRELLRELCSDVIECMP